MNNYFKNQIRRANCGLVKKVALYAVALLCPGKLRRIWREHANDMQNELNVNNWDRHRFYVNHHNVIQDWFHVINYGYFNYDPQA